MTDTEDDSFYLDRVRNYANWIEYGARHMGNDVLTLSRYASMVNHQRNFETFAEEALDHAEKSLKEALEAITETRKRYKGLKIA